MVGKKMKWIRRPWGRYAVIYSDENKKVKIIEIKPLKRTSKQYHHHRFEHWTVLSGNLLALIGSDVVSISSKDKDPTAFVAISQVHRIMNPSKKYKLIILEIQRGKCYERDIIRLEDDFGR